MWCGNASLMRLPHVLLVTKKQRGKANSLEEKDKIRGQIKQVKERMTSLGVPSDKQLVSKSAIKKAGKAFMKAALERENYTR